MDGNQKSFLTPMGSPGLFCDVDGDRLHVHLSLLIQHNYLPHAFILLLIVPLIKNKDDDRTDVNNYTAIMM
jgi:hypothetical protein